MLTDDERLALLAAMEKRIRPLLEDEKAGARARLLATKGAKALSIEVGGTEVGTVAATRTKARPYIYEERMAEALDFLGEHGLAVRIPAKGWEEAFAMVGGHVVLKETGEAVDWAGWEPESVKGASVRGCRPDDVIAAFGPRLSGMSAAALIEGEVG